MENRFGVKDFFLFLIISCLIVLVVLTMFQYDRQWALEQATSNQVNDLTHTVSDIRKMLAQGGTQIQSSNPANNEATVGFERILKSQAQPDYAEGDDLVQITESQAPALTPMINQDAYTQLMEYYTYDSLVDLDPQTFQWLPRLAVKWTISPDMHVIDFWLRHGVTFSNGDPFTADDVIYTFNWVMNEKVQLPMQRSYLNLMTGVEKIDDFHVRFHFSESYFMSFDSIAYGNVLIMDKAFYSKYSPDEFNTNPGLVMGTGPYRTEDPTSWRGRGRRSIGSSGRSLKTRRLERRRSLTATPISGGRDISGRMRSSTTTSLTIRRFPRDRSISIPIRQPADSSLSAGTSGMAVTDRQRILPIRACGAQ
jgi:peptide/nickel transport system substrate-binding protein